MFRFLRARLTYAGQIGWLDGRRGYPAENDFVDLPLHGVLPAVAVPPAPTGAAWKPDASAAALAGGKSAAAALEDRHALEQA